MPKFAYVAVDTAGTTVEGQRKGDTIGDIRAWLKLNDLYPVRIDEVSRRWLDLEITTEKLKRRELMHFSRQLAVFIRAGIPIITALETISDEATDKVLRRVIADMVERLNAGATFAEAAGAHPEAFPSYYVGVLRSAELTGSLDDTVDSLAAYLERDIEARSKIVSAMVYPLVVLLMALGTISLLAFLVLPQFKELFDDLGADLPLSTTILLAFVAFFTDLWFIPLGISLAIAGFVVWMIRTPQGKVFRDRMVLRVPGLGTIVQYSILERFCRILSTMTSAGVPLPEAMEVVTEASNNTVFRERLDEAREAVMHGEGLARPLIETGLFPGAARQMLAVGEESGTIDRQLATAAQYFDRELDVRLKRFTSIFEPATIIFVGLTVGFVAIALVQAMYGMLGGLNE